MNLNRICVLGSLLIGAVLFGGSEAGAVTTYTYTGNNFGFIFDRDPPAGTYTTSMNVSGFFTLSSPLAENQVSYTPLSFSFFDGRNTFTNTTPNTISEFLFQADAFGNILSWTVFLQTQSGQSRFQIISSTDFDTFGFFDLASIFTSVAGFSDEGVSFRAPGQWSVTTTPEVPLPAALPLFATGLGVLGLLAWRRKRKIGANAAV